MQPPTNSIEIKHPQTMNGTYQHKLDVFRQSKRVPHILFYGDSGSGKKTVVYNFIYAIYQDACIELNRHNNNNDNDNQVLQIINRNVMWVNCAQGKGIKFVRNELKMFAQTNACTGVPFKTIVLLNADHLTVDAQSALRRCMEQYSQTARFFGIVRNRHRLMCPILSRFCEIHVCEPVSENLHQRKILAMFPHITDDWTQTSAIISDTVSRLISNQDTHVHLVELLYDQGISSLDLLRWMRQDQAIQVGITREKLVHICMCSVAEKNEYHHEKLFMYRILEQLLN